MSEDYPYEDEVPHPEEHAQGTPLMPTEEAPQQDPPSSAQAEEDPSAMPSFEATFAEPHLGVAEFLAIAPQLRPMSAGVRKGAEAALKRWMQVAGHDVYGHYPLAQWQDYYASAMGHTG